MNSQQPSQAPFHSNMATPKEQSTLGGSCSRLWMILTDIPYTLKGVQVTYLNKLYKGIAFLNDAGGMEFYSPESKSRLANKIITGTDLLRQSLNEVQEELEYTASEIQVGHEHLDDWLSSLHQKEAECRHFHEQLDNLILLAKQGKISQDERETSRFQLLADLRIADRSRRNIKNHIDRYHEKMKKKPFLDIYYDELKAKIRMRERDVIAANTFTVNRSDILSRSYFRGHRSKDCCVFADVLDYLAYRHLTNENQADGFPRSCDCVVLNDPRNFLKLLLRCDVYDHIYCFFPDTIAGKTMEETLIERKGAHAESMTYLYDGYVTLFAYSTSTDDYSPLNMIR